MSTPARSWTERSATVGGVRIVFDERPGTSPTLVVIHGFLGSGAAMMPLFEALHTHGALDERGAAAVDVVGHGRSDAPTSVAPYTMERVVEQLGSVLDLIAGPDDAGGTPVDVIGYSMGGRVALALAVAHPHRLRRLVLIGATAGIEDQAERAARRRADAELASLVEQQGIEAFVDRWEQLPIFATQMDLAPEVRARVRAGRTAQRPTGVANSLRGTGTGSMEPMWEQLAALTVPTLVLAGAFDAKYVEIGARLADALPVGRFEAIAGAGHAAHVERPEATAAAVGAFLGGVDIVDDARSAPW